MYPNFAQPKPNVSTTVGPSRFPNPRSPFRSVAVCGAQQAHDTNDRYLYLYLFFFPLSRVFVGMNE